MGLLSCTKNLRSTQELARELHPKTVLLSQKTNCRIYRTAGKFSREKTFTTFEDFWLFAKVKFGSVTSFDGTSEQSAKSESFLCENHLSINSWKISPSKVFCYTVLCMFYKFRRYVPVQLHVALLLPALQQRTLGMFTRDQKSSRCSLILDGLYLEYRMASSVNMPMWARSRPSAASISVMSSLKWPRFW